jgi:hypothetical protein
MLASRRTTGADLVRFARGEAQPIAVHQPFFVLIDRRTTTGAVTAVLFGDDATTDRVPAVVEVRGAPARPSRRERLRFDVARKRQPRRPSRRNRPVLMPVVEDEPEARSAPARARCPSATFVANHQRMIRRALPRCSRHARPVSPARIRPINAVESLMKSCPEPPPFVEHRRFCGARPSARRIGPPRRSREAEHAAAVIAPCCRM